MSFEASGYVSWFGWWLHRCVYFVKVSFVHFSVYMYICVILQEKKKGRSKQNTNTEGIKKEMCMNLTHKKYNCSLFFLILQNFPPGKLRMKSFPWTTIRDKIVSSEQGDPHLFNSLVCICFWSPFLLLLSRFSRVRLCATHRRQPTRLPRPFDCQARNWSGLPFPSPMHENEKWKWSRSVVSDSSRPHALQPTRFPRPWGFPGKSPGMGCHCLLRSPFLIPCLLVSHCWCN